MNIKAAILSVLALLCSLCATAQYQYQIYPVDWKELKTLVKEESVNWCGESPHRSATRR